LTWRAFNKFPLEQNVPDVEGGEPADGFKLTQPCILKEQEHGIYRGTSYSAILLNLVAQKKKDKA
jgi:hypothetical protein